MSLAQTSTITYYGGPRPRGDVWMPHFGRGLEISQAHLFLERTCEKGETEYTEPRNAMQGIRKTILA